MNSPFSINSKLLQVEKSLNDPVYVICEPTALQNCATKCINTQACSIHLKVVTLSIKLKMKKAEKNPLAQTLRQKMENNVHPLKQKCTYKRCLFQLHTLLSLTSSMSY